MEETEDLSGKKRQKQRGIAARAKRRLLANINPENSNPQRECLLFSALPSEIRNLIFQMVLCQQFDHQYPINDYIIHYQPHGHIYLPRISYALLQTCRLIYYETSRIPMLSATHHIDWTDNSHYRFYYLFHMPSQQTRNLYHLHLTMHIMGLTLLDRYIKCPYLAWKKITWTIRASLWPRFFIGTSNIPDFESILKAVKLPTSCKDVTLELECLAHPKFQLHESQKNQTQRDRVENFVAACRKVRLYRRDQTYLDLDEDACIEFTWEGSIGASHPLERTKVPAVFHVSRLRWKSKDAGTERERMRYDYLDCLNSNDMKIIRRSTVEDL